MNQSNIQDSIKKYEQITGEKFEIPADHAIKIIGDNFMVWKLGIRNGLPFFYLNQTYAKSFSVFVPFIREVCKSADIEWIVTSTKRNPRAHVKKWHMQRVEEEDWLDYNGKHYYVLKSHIDNLK